VKIWATAPTSNQTQLNEDTIVWSQIRGHKDCNYSIVGSDTPLRKVIVEGHVVPDQVVLRIHRKSGCDCARIGLGNEWGIVNIGRGSELDCAAARIGKQVTVDQSIHDCVGTAVRGGTLTVNECEATSLSFVDISCIGHENGEGERVAVNLMERRGWWVPGPSKHRSTPWKVIRNAYSSATELTLMLVEVPTTISSTVVGALLTVSVR
jgi:hypothetical protein